MKINYSIKISGFRNIIIGVLILFLNHFSLSQSTFDFIKYRKYYNSAKLNYYNKKYNEAKKSYEECFKYMKKEYIVNICYGGYINCLLKNKDSVEAEQAEEKYLALGLVNYIDSSSLFQQFGNKFGIIIVDRLPKIRHTYENDTTDISNRLVIEELVSKDQAAREQFGKIPKSEFERLLIDTDSINFLTFYQLVKYKNANPACFLIYHIYDENRKYYTFIDSALKYRLFSGEIAPEAYVQWYDRQRIYVDGKKTQLYGEWNNQQEGSDEFNPIEDIQNIDKRRGEFGLCSLKDYAIMHQLKLPKDYVPPK